MGKNQSKGSKESSNIIIPPDGTISPVLGSYKVKGILGKGGFGEVLLVEHMKEKKLYALKKIQPRDEKEEEMAMHEMEFLKSLNHKAIVSYKEFFKFIKGKERVICIVMEYCPQGNLADILKRVDRETLPSDVIIQWFIPLLDGLAYIHSKGILHRDLKPQNIFLTEEMEVKIGDFGIAKILSPGNYANTIIGTEYYLAPEVFQKQPYDHKADIWALGCILYEVATGEVLKEPMAIKILRDKNTLEKVQDPSIAAILSSMLQIEPKQRPSARDLLQNRIIVGYKMLLDLDDIPQDLSADDPALIPIATSIGRCGTLAGQLKCFVIAAVAISSPKFQKLLVEVGAIPRILSMLQEKNQQSIMALGLLQGFLKEAQDLEQNQTVLQNAGAVDILWKVIGQSSEVLENLGIIRYLCINNKELQYAFQSFGMGDVIKAVVDVLIQKGKSAEPPLDVHLWYSLFNEPSVLKLLPANPRTTNEMQQIDIFAQSRFYAMKSKAPETLYQLGFFRLLLSAFSSSYKGFQWIMESLLDFSYPLNRASCKEVCTYCVTNQAYVNANHDQYFCVQCFGTKMNLRLCGVCAAICHEGHKGVIYLGNDSAMFCDCTIENKCKAMTSERMNSWPQWLQCPFVSVKPPLTHVTFQNPNPNIIEITNQTEIKYTGGRESDAVSLQANKALAIGSNMTTYFEVTVLHSGWRNLVGVGIAPPNYPINQFPGLQKGSFGYHGDDGNIFLGSGRASFTRAKFGVNDTIGCGISPSGQVFFTKNGFFLGFVGSIIQYIDYYPTVGLKCPHTHIRVNFGQHPFVFNLRPIEKDWYLPLVRKNIQQQFNSLDLMKSLFTYLSSSQFEKSQFCMVLFVIEGLLRGDRNAVDRFRSSGQMSQLQQFLQRNPTLNTRWTQEMIERIQAIDGSESLEIGPNTGGKISAITTTNPQPTAPKPTGRRESTERTDQEQLLARIAELEGKLSLINMSAQSTPSNPKVTQPTPTNESSKFPPNLLSNPKVTQPVPFNPPPKFPGFNTAVPSTGYPATTMQSRTTPLSLYVCKNDSREEVFPLQLEPHEVTIASLTHAAAQELGCDPQKISKIVKVAPNNLEVIIRSDRNVQTLKDEDKLVIYLN